MQTWFLHHYQPSNTIDELHGEWGASVIWAKCANFVALGKSTEL